VISQISDATTAKPVLSATTL